jgi:hypothetical protein
LAGIHDPTQAWARDVEAKRVFLILAAQPADAGGSGNPHTHAELERY